MTGRPISETGDEYWVSGVKKDGLDRHWAGAGKVSIETGVVREYLALVGAAELDDSRFTVVDDLPSPDTSRFHGTENKAEGE